MIMIIVIFFFFFYCFFIFIRIGINHHGKVATKAHCWFTLPLLAGCLWLVLRMVNFFLTDSTVIIAIVIAIVIAIAIIVGAVPLGIGAGGSAAAELYREPSVVRALHDRHRHRHR